MSREETYARKLKLARRAVLRAINKISLTEAKKSLFKRKKWHTKPTYKRAFDLLVDEGKIGRIGNRYFPTKWLKST